MHNAAVPVLVRAAVATALVLASLPLSVLVPAGTPLAPNQALAATVTWTGNAFNDARGEAANWTKLPATGDDLVLTSSGPVTPNLNTLPVSVVLRSVTLNSRFPGYDITGNSISLQSGGFITHANTEGLGDLIHTGVSLNGAAIFTLSAGARGLVFGTKPITGTGPLTLVNNSTDDALSLNVANTYTGATTIGGTGRVRATVNGVIPAGSALTVNGSFSGAGGTIGSLAGGGTVGLGSIGLTAGGDNTSTTFSGVLSGPGGLTKAGTGTLTLSGANTYSGGTTVSAGTLQIGAGGTAGSVAGNITNNATVIFNRSDNVTYAGVVSGTGGLTKSGTGTLTLSGANTYSGGTTVSAGTLAGTTTSLRGNITNNATVTFDQGSDGTYAGVISGTGGVTKTGAGTVTLAGNNTYSGATTIQQGGLTVGAGATVAGPITVQSGTTLTIGAGGTVNGQVTVEAGGSVTVNGTLSQPVGTTTTLASSVNPSTSGQSVTFTATVAGASPTETVTFKDGATTLGTGTLSDGQAAFSTSSLSTGARSITAEYGGDANNAFSTSAALTQTVNAQPTVTLGLTGSPMAEAGGAATVTATLSAASTLDTTVNLGLTGTATGGGTDYTASGASITILAPATTGSITLTAVQDALDEANETVIVDITSVTNGTESGTQQVTATITDDDATPSVSFTAAPQSVSEGAGTATVTAQLSAASGLAVTVPFTLSGTATGADYSATASPLSIAAESTTASVTITLTNDTLDEADETVIVTMGTPVNATKGATTVHTLTITDDDAPPSVSFTAASQSVSEGGGTATITAQLSATSSFAVTVPFTLSGTATGADYSATASPLSIAAESTTASVTITLTNDTLDEADETVIVTMGSPTNAGQGATTVHTLTITDDDAAPAVTLTVNNATITEAGGSATITATLSPASGLDVTVNLGFSGTAVSGADYNASSTAITIAAGGTTGTATITAVDDAVDESDETAVVDVTSVTNGTESGTQQVTITIRDNDETPRGGGGSPAPPAGPPTAASQGIDPAAGGTLSLGGVSIVLPPGAVPGTEGATVTLENATLTGKGSAQVFTAGDHPLPNPLPSRERGLLAAMTLPVPEGSAFGAAAFTFTVQGSGGKPLGLAAPVTVSAKYSEADKVAGSLKLMAYNGDMRWIDLKADDDGVGTLTAHTTMTGLFAIIVELPKPVLSGPASGTVTSDLGPLLSWTNPSGATQHQLQVIPFNDDGPGINLIRNGETSYQIQAPAFGTGGYVMLPGMSYTWRVRTSSSPTSLGESDAGWSHWVAGTFRTPAPSSSTIRPAGPVDASLLPTLAWKDSNTQVFYYEVQLSKDPGLGMNAFLYWELRHGGVTSPPNSYTVPRQYPLEQGTEYYWRVRPRVQGDGEPVAWSEVWSFRTP